MMELSVSVYINHSELPNHIGKNTALHLCHMIESIVPGQTMGAQFVKGVWSVWLRSIRAKCYLAGKIRDLEIDGIKVSIHDTYPSSKPIPNEKIVLRDLPPDVSDNAIRGFLKDQPGISVKSGVMFSRIRNNENKLPFCSGDRFVYARGNIANAIHTTALIEQNKCRVWHKTQETACAGCRKTDHTTTNTESCDAFREDPDAILIRSPSNVMCNYYKCYIKAYGIKFPTSEHAYQWRFMKYLGHHEFALEILNARTPSEAKEISLRVPRCQHKDWHSIKLQVMKEVLHAKADYSPIFRSALINSVGKRLVECTQDIFWTSGLSPRLSASTKSDYYPGKNKLGEILESVRNDLIKEEVMSQLLNTPNKNEETCVSHTDMEDIYTP